MSPTLSVGPGLRVSRCGRRRRNSVRGCTGTNQEIPRHNIGCLSRTLERAAGREAHCAFTHAPPPLIARAWGAEALSPSANGARDVWDGAAGTAEGRLVGFLSGGQSTRALGDCATNAHNVPEPRRVGGGRLTAGEYFSSQHQEALQIKTSLSSNANRCNK